MGLKSWLEGLHEKTLAHPGEPVHTAVRVSPTENVRHGLRLPSVQLRGSLPHVRYSPMLQLLLCFLGIDYRLNQLPLHLKRLESCIALPWCVFPDVSDLLEQALRFLGSYFILEVRQSGFALALP